jgi:hypothetical protein
MGCRQRDLLDIDTYRPTAAPRAAGPSVFAASERPGSANVLTALATSPSVLPLSVVDNSVFSPNRLTLPIDTAYPS